MASEETKKVDELDILAEIPQSLKIGDKDFLLRPLSFGKIKLLGDVLLMIFQKVEAFGKMGTADPEQIQQILSTNWASLIDELILGVQIITCQNGKTSFDELKNDKEMIEFLRWNFTTEQLKVVSDFIRNSIDLGGIIKNVAPLRRI